MKLRHRTKGLVPVLIAAISTACATSKPVEEPIARGWLAAGGELRLYPRRADFGKTHGGVCISGVMSRGRVAPKRYDQKYVEVYGGFISASVVSDLAENLASIGVENYCNSPRILVVRRLVIRKPPKS